MELSYFRDSKSNDDIDPNRLDIVTCSIFIFSLVAVIEVVKLENVEQDIRFMLS